MNDEPAFTYAVSFGPYEGVLRKAINLLKYHNIKRLSKPLSDIILKTGIPRADVIIPVPLYEKRLRHREFNQSALLAKHMAKSLGVALILNCLVKIRDTMPQVGLSSKERIMNIRKAFKTRNKGLITDKNVLLVDDVLTTGATVRECSNVLKKSGAGNIYVVTLAHGVKD
jgi:ComF family protein